MVKESYFKKYKRDSRIQSSEEVFGLGMNCSNAPLKEGASKYLVNFDILDFGEVLKPRPGLWVKNAALHPKHLIHESTPLAHADGMFLLAGKECVESNNKSYKQLLIGTPDELLSGTKLHQGTLHVATIYEDEDSYEEASAVPGPLPLNGVESIPTQEMHLEPLVDDLEVACTTFRKPSEAEIHGISLSDPSALAKHVGTFGFNNSYYFFKHPVEGDPLLMQTKLVTAAGVSCYKGEAVTPRNTTPKEAVMWGYNMLSKNPYTFLNTSFLGTIQLLGLLPYDASGALVTTPQKNQELTFECFYAAPTGNTYKFEWEWKEPAATNWIKFKTESIALTLLPKLKANLSVPVNEVMLRITATLSTETDPEKVLVVGFNLNKDQYGSTVNVKPLTYNIPKAKGLVYWKNRLVAYGLAEDETVMLVSEVNDPSYFPYPNNADIFDEPIVYILPFLDYLLVFTSSKIYHITLSMDGLSWTKKTIQGNLDIKPWDIHLIQAVKNMVFFKSGNYYYMVVPSRTSLTGDLVIAPISKPIEAFFDSFLQHVRSIADTVYGYTRLLNLVHYYNYLDFEDVHNVYVFKTDTGLCLNVALLYNIVARNWRCYCYESQGVLVPFEQNATRKGALMNLFPVNQSWLTSGAVLETGVLPGIQFLEFDNSRQVRDVYIPDNYIYDPGEIGPEEIIPKLNTFHFFKNYQLLDTGHREHSTDFKKRYRECQLKIHNTSQLQHKFYTEFYIDGDTRRSMSKYTMQHNTDADDPNYGLLYLQREFVDPSLIPGSTALAESEEDYNGWTLDVSTFSELAFWKVRIPISGKGYSPRLKLITISEQTYELLNISWVARTLNSR